jgi:predicted RNA-binding Zn ribbon-like protein
MVHRQTQNEGVREPGDRAPAPEPVRLVQRFVNTVDLEGGPEGLPDAAALRGWLDDAGLLGPGERVSDEEHARAIALREALRALAYANGGHDADPRAIDVVNDAARRAGLQPVLTGPSAGALQPAARGVDAALGRIVAAVHAGIADGTWPRLKACERESCRWAFYDHSRNHAGQWCSMAVCGSREKNRRAYRRRRDRGRGRGPAG